MRRDGGPGCVLRVRCSYFRSLLLGRRFAVVLGLFCPVLWATTESGLEHFPRCSAVTRISVMPGCGKDAAPESRLLRKGCYVENLD